MVYNAVDERFLTEPLPADADRILERHAVNSPYVLYAGNIKPQKNLPRLIEAFAVAKAELRGNPEFAQLKLLVIGEALTRHADLRRAVVRARVREDVRFLGFVPRPVLRVFYSRALAFLFPSLYEGFGLPPLEAMAHGTPVLTSNVSSLPEVFHDAALLVNPENVFDIARGIRQILTENVLRANAQAQRLRARANVLLGKRGAIGSRRVSFGSGSHRRRMTRSSGASQNPQDSNESAERPRGLDPATMRKARIG